MVGRLKDLPRTFLGALILGLLTSYAQWAVQYIPRDFQENSDGLVQGTRLAIPTLFLLAVMLAMPHEKLRVGRISGTIAAAAAELAEDRPVVGDLPGREPSSSPGCCPRRTTHGSGRRCACR